MKRTVTYITLMITFALVPTGLPAQTPTGDLAERLSAKAIDTQAISEMIHLLRSANSEEFERGRQIAVKMWFSSDPETRCQGLMYMCEPHVRIANIKEILLRALENETDLKILECVGEKLGSQEWTDQEYISILRIAYRLNARSDGSPDPYCYRVKQEIVSAATVGKGPSAYPLLVRFAKDNPNISGVPDNWIFTLIGSRNPQGFRDGLEALRRSSNKYDIVPYITHLRDATKRNLSDGLEFDQMESCYKGFVDDIAGKARDANADTEVRVYALDALKSLGEYSSPTLATAYNIANSDPELWRRAIDDKSPDQRRKAIRLIGQLDVVNQIEPLKQLVLHETDPSTRETALFALRDMPGPECTLAFEEMIKQMPDADDYKGRIRLAWKQQKKLAPTVLPRLESTDTNKEPKP